MNKDDLFKIALLIVLVAGIGFFIWTIQSGSFECKMNPISYAEEKLTQKYNEPIYCECSRTPSIQTMLNFSNFTPKE